MFSMCSFNIHDSSSKITTLKLFKDTCHFLNKLFFADIDSLEGIKITVDQPSGNKAMLNIKRPQVMRQEYGDDVFLSFPITRRFNKHLSNGVLRYFYGFSDKKMAITRLEHGLKTNLQDQCHWPLKRWVIFYLNL